MASLYHKYPDRPDLALDEMYATKPISLYTKPTVFVWTSTKAKSGTRYGSYKYVPQDSLVGREYIVEWGDCAPSILFTDCYYCEQQRRIIMKEKNEKISD